MIIHFNLTVLNYFSGVSLCSIKYVMVKTLIEKNSPLPKSEGPVTQFG